MNTTELFGIQFALKNRYKAQIVEDFDRWKSEKQWFLAEERNKQKLFDQAVTKHRQDYPKDYRPPEEIASELWENLKKAAARTNWQQVYEDELGSDYEFPNYNGSPYITTKNVKDLLVEPGCRHYYFTGTAVDECNKVKLTEPLDPRWLLDSADGKRQLNFGDQFIRYEKRGGRILALAASITRRQECNYLQHTFFTLNLRHQVPPQQHYDPLVELIQEMSEKELDSYTEAFDDKSRMLLYNMITFLDLIKLRKVLLPAGKCLEGEASASGGEELAENINNNVAIPLTIVDVDANWNCSLYIEETEVTGYFKDVLCGKGRTKIIRRFIKQHHRRGYEIPAGKLRATGN